MMMIRNGSLYKVIALKESVFPLVEALQILTGEARILEFCNRSSLVALAATSKQLNYIVTDYLRHNIEIPLTLDKGKLSTVTLMKMLAVFSSKMLACEYRSYSETVRFVDELLGLNSEKEKINVLRLMLKEGYQSKKVDWKNMVTVYSKFEKLVQKHIFLALICLKSVFRKEVISKLISTDNLEMIDGRYKLTIDSNVFFLGLKKNGDRAIIGLFKSENDQERVLSGTVMYRTLNPWNDYIKYKRGLFYSNEVLKKGRIDFNPNEANGFTNFREGEFEENGDFRKGRIQFVPVAANTFIKSVEGEFEENGNFREGRIKFDPNPENVFTKSEEGEFENGRLRKGRKEFEPNEANGFTESIEGEYYENGVLREGRIEYSKGTLNNLGLLSWKVTGFVPYPGLFSGWF